MKVVATGLLRELLCVAHDKSVKEIRLMATQAALSLLEAAPTEDTLKVVEEAAADKNSE